MTVRGDSLRHRTTASTCIALLIIVSAVSCVGAFAGAEDDGVADWTIMVYVAGDNDLEGMAPVNLDELEGACPSEDVNVIMLIDTLTLLEGTHWFFVNDGDDHWDPVSGIFQCDCHDVDGGCPGELNMGEAATLDYFITK
ncbi:TPA: hypothetical protein HA259_09500 [Thermoplasmata archaeon]|nr:hypothetical protein [Thermoplasmata archaeon]